MEDKKSYKIGETAVYDARSLGGGRMFVLGFQHMFAMFGATVLVPALTGLSVSATLLFAGLGTLFFHLVTGRMIPAFLGSSFAFLGGYWAIIGSPGTESFNASMIPYACFGVACAGLVYLIISALFRAFGPRKVMKFFPPVVTGPIIIAIGLILGPSALNNCSSDWIVALVAIFVVVICNIWGKGMIKVVPVLLGVVVSYIVAACIGHVDWSGVRDAAWVGLPVLWDNTIFALAKGCQGGLLVTAIVTIVPIALATIVEHIGDVSAISSTCERNFIANPGLHRTLLGDGGATILAACFGAPANTTYGENTGVLALTKVYDPKVVEIAAGLAILFSLCPKFAAVISAMPAGTVGGISLVLYGMISAVGVRNLIENQVDFTKSRNIIIAALILVLAIGISYSSGLGADTAAGVSGSIKFGSNVSLSGLAVGALVGIIVNAILPGKDFIFHIDQGYPETDLSGVSSETVQEDLAAISAQTREADALAAAQEQEFKAAAEAAVAAESLEKKTVAELKKVAAAEKVDLAGVTRKADIIAAIEKARK